MRGLGFPSMVEMLLLCSGLLEVRKLHAHIYINNYTHVHEKYILKYMNCFKSMSSMQLHCKAVPYTLYTVYLR